MQLKSLGFQTESAVRPMRLAQCFKRFDQACDAVSGGLFADTPELGIEGLHVDAAHACVVLGRPARLHRHGQDAFGHSQSNGVTQDRAQRPRPRCRVTTQDQCYSADGIALLVL